MGKEELAGLLREAAAELDGQAANEETEFIRDMYLPRIGNVHDFYMGNMSWVRRSPLRVNNDLFAD